MEKIYFLGGHDLEMVTIRDLLAEHVLPSRFYDKNLPQEEAEASDYREEIIFAIKKGLTPVLIELRVDMELEKDEIIVIDHHGKRAGKDKPTSLHQVFKLLNLPNEKWTRWFDLVAANDRGYIPAMLEIGATKEEIIKVRTADRAAQGITHYEERVGETAVATAEISVNGMLTTVHLPHARIATVIDRMEPALGGPGYKNLLILLPRKMYFIGERWIAEKLNYATPGGWFGYDLSGRGTYIRHEPVERMLDYLKQIITTL